MTEVESVHPGDVLFEMLKQRKMAMRTLARTIKMSPAYISDLCGRRRKFGVPISMRLEKVFDEPAEFWLELQMRYDLAKARGQ